MRNRHPQIQLGHRVLSLSLTWLFLGAVTGVINGQGMGGSIELVSRMIVLTTLGLFLGVIGGDARGSIVGAAGGLLGCSLANLGGVAALQPVVISTVVIFGGLLGATGFLFMRFLVWKYRTILKSICWLIDLTPISGKMSARLGRLPIPQRLASNSVPHEIPSFARRFR
jgi:hypothetical protein